MPGTFHKPHTFEEALRVASPTVTTEPKYRTYGYKAGSEDGFNDYRSKVLDHLRTATQLQFLKQDFLADMQNESDVEKWLGYTPRSQAPTVMCVYNALCEVKKSHLDPSPKGEKFTWEIDYLLRKTFDRNTMVNTTKLFTLHRAIDEVKQTGGTYLAVIFRQVDKSGASEPKVPKKSVVAGGISHMQVWKGPGGGARFEIEDRQSGKEEWVTGDKRVVLWKIE